MNTLKDARDIIDRHILTYMHEMSPDNSDWLAFPLSCFVDDFITKEMVRAACRDLRNRGLATFERGLFTDSGEVAGAGYTITKAGREYVKTLREGADGFALMNRLLVLPKEPVAFRCDYRNWRGEVASRRLIAIEFWYGSTEWHPEPGLMLKAIDRSKGAMRDFRVADFDLSTFQAM